jgi:hypothetical protein
MKLLEYHAVHAPLRVHLVNEGRMKDNVQDR